MATSDIATDKFEPTDDISRLASHETARIVRDLRAKVAELEAEHARLHLAVVAALDHGADDGEAWPPGVHYADAIEVYEELLKVERWKAVAERDALARHCIYPGPDGVWRGLIHADALAEQWGYFDSEAAAGAGVRRAAGLGDCGPGTEGGPT
jgi:hypothetical protein